MDVQAPISAEGILHGIAQHHVVDSVGDRVAYITNRIWVFQSKVKGVGRI